MATKDQESTVTALPISQIDNTIIESDIPARLDRLPWSNFHTLVVVALGFTWVLVGLEFSLADTLSSAIRASLELAGPNDDAAYEFTNTAYLVGAVCGALYFGSRADRFGRKKMFLITLIVYGTFTAATAFSLGLWSLAGFRFLTGAGIGGEYVAINSTIQELIPTKYRGRAVLAVNGSWWLGVAIIGAASIVLPDWVFFSSHWRAAFFVGGLLACSIYFMRQWLPESPRWLMTHHRADEGEAIVELIEEGIRNAGHDLKPVNGPPSRLRGRRYTSFREFMLTLFAFYPHRTVAVCSLMAAQAFFYNGFFFSYEPVLTHLFGLHQIGWYRLFFAIGNFAGPLMLGWLFDTLGRRLMVGLTYALSGILLAASGILLAFSAPTPVQQNLAWTVVFFFASAAASSAYLAAGESFPLEVRGLAFGFAFAIGTGIFGAPTPWLFGAMVDTTAAMEIFVSYLFGAALMIGAAIVQWFWGVNAEGKSLESVARPLTFTD
jgi:MFS family permease